MMAITELTDGLPNADGQQSARRDGHHQARSATQYGKLAEYNAMPETIIVHHRIPIAKKGAGLLLFHKWLPLSPGDVIVVNSENVTTSLRIDESCQQRLFKIPLEEVQRHSNVPVECILVDVEVSSVADDLHAFIRDEHEAPRGIHHGVSLDDPGYGELAKRYLETGVIVQKQAIAIVDRVLAFARTVKGQYWLERIRFEENMISSRNVQFCTKVSSPVMSRRRWCPPAQDKIIASTVASARFVTQKEWPMVRDFASSFKRPKLMLELLANAESSRGMVTAAAVLSRV
ncbi:MAG: hypothetical protein HC869_05235 [Rhodospirillales bacterium]|nr:hypothetical protein [Rhodospirillales bacterium]